MTRSHLLLPFTLLLAGCGGALDPGGQTVGEATAAFSGNWYYSWSTDTNDEVDIGSSANRTCFLTGMSGNPQVDVAVRIADFSPYDYLLDVDTNENGRFGAGFAACINSSAGRTAEKYWVAGQPAVVLAPVAAGRRCFLTGVSPDGGFIADGDSVQVFHDSANWYLGGFQSATHNWVDARARCIDVSVDEGHWEWIAGETGSRKDELAYNSGGVNCFLTGLAGRFNQPDATDGAFITYESGLNQYFMNTKNGKSGWAQCVK
jgi:hypothetical protein